MANADQISGKPLKKGEKKKLNPETKMASSFGVAERIKLAIKTYKDAVERRTRLHGENSSQVARSLRDLGELYLDERRLDEAEEVVKRALEIRAASATLPKDDDDDAARGVRRDAAMSRKVLGRIYEQRGDIEAARSIRATGLELGQVICGHESVRVTSQLANQYYLCMKWFEHVVDLVTLKVR